MTRTNTVDVSALAEFLAHGAQSVRSRGGRWDGNRDVSAGSHAFNNTGPNGDGVYMHGPDGLFHVYDAEQKLISLQRYGSSLATELPSKASNMLYPLFGYIGGWGAGGGEDEPMGSCDPAPTAGSLYTCWQTAQFGTYRRETQVIDIANIGQYTGRSEFSDFLLINPPPDLSTVLAPTTPGGSLDINREFILRMMALGIEFERLLGPQVFYGNPDNSSGEAGGYAEYPGLDILISTGHVDAMRSGVTCTGLDSLIYNYNYASVDDAGGATIVTLLTSVMRYMRTLSRITNLDQVEWAFAMRDDLFNAICDVWPCAYLANRCAITAVADGGASTGAVGNIDLSTIVKLREDMRNGSYIEIDGMKVQVIRDSWIREKNHTTNSGDLDVGEYASDIYLVPKTVRNNIAATYFEYLNWDGAPMQAIRDAGREEFFAVSDGGRWLWTLPAPTQTCFSAGARIRPRLIELCPHLCAHLANLSYAPLIHQPDVNPGGSFFVTGSPDPINFTIPMSLWNP